MREDTRCCGTGTCLINADGLCWCGQHWDGTKMCFEEQRVAAKPKELGPAEGEVPPAAPLLP